MKKNGFTSNKKLRKSQLNGSIRKDNLSEASLSKDLNLKPNISSGLKINGPYQIHKSVG